MSSLSKLIKKYINNAILKMKSNNYDSVISVTEDHGFLWEKKDEFIVPKFHDPKNRIRRQDSNPTFRETGSIYATIVSNVIYNNSLMYGGSKTGYVLIPKNRSFEIDNYEDITLIEAIIKYNANE